MDNPSSVDTGLIKSLLLSQYRASLKMLNKAITICSPDLWESTAYRNLTWKIAYHTLYFTDLYLYQHLDQWKAWEKHLPGTQNLGESTHEKIYSRDESLEFLRYIDDRIEAALHDLDISVVDSGFYWYKIPKLEHQFVNLKHLHHHLGQLQDRIRNHQDVGIDWVRNS